MGIIKTKMQKLGVIISNVDSSSVVSNDSCSLSINKKYGINGSYKQNETTII